MVGFYGVDHIMWGCKLFSFRRSHILSTLIQDIFKVLAEKKALNPETEITYLTNYFKHKVRFLKTRYYTEVQITPNLWQHTHFNISNKIVKYASDSVVMQ